MSNKNDLFAPPSDNELNDPLFAPPSDEELSPISKTDSLLKGTQDMVLMGSADEFAGGVQSLLDKLARNKDTVNKFAGALGPLGAPVLGLANMALPEGVTKTPDQVNEKLLAQGFTGDLDSVYTSGRNATREEFKAAEEANPEYYMGGQVLGGALTAVAPMGVGKALTMPFGVAKPSLNAIKAAELAGTTAKAGLLAKTGKAAANVAPAGAIIGYGQSEAEEVPEQLLDSAKSAALGSVMAGGLTGAAGAVGGTLNKTGQIIGDKFPGLAHVYERGLQGVKTYGKEFTDATNKQLDQYTQTLGNFLKTKRDVVNQARQKVLQGVDDQIANVDASLQDEMQMLQSALSSSKEIDRQSLMKQINTQSVKTQQDLSKIKKNVGKVYDNLEKKIQDKNISFNVNDELSQFGEDLQLAGLQPEEALQFSKKIMVRDDLGDLPLNELRTIKSKLAGLFNSGKSEVRKAAKLAYGRINDKQVNILETAGDVDLANSMKDVNQRYKSILQLEEDYIGQITPNRVTGTIEPSNEMQKTISSFGSVKPSAKDFRTQEEFQKLSQVADPQFAQQSTEELNKLASQLKANEALDVAGPKIDDLRSTSNRYQELLKQKEALAQRPKVDTKFDKFTNIDETNELEKDVKDYLTSNFKSTIEDIDNVAKKDMKSIYNAYKKDTGKDILPDIETLVKDASVIQEAAEGAKGVGVQTIGGFKSFGQDPVNMLGRAVGKLRKFNDPNAKVYENQIGEALRKGTKPALDALYFSLMQQPQFRKMMQEDKVDESKP